MFSVPYNIRCCRFLCAFVLLWKKNKRRRRNWEIFITCLYRPIKLNWVGNKWPLKHGFHLLVLHLKTNNFLIFILKQAQWHCVKERQSQEFALFDCQTDFSRLAICIHTLRFFGNSSGASVIPNKVITQNQRTINGLFDTRYVPNMPYKKLELCQLNF